MNTYDCEILYQPDREELRFLPEGPYPCGEEKFSWVAIQHAADKPVGSLNIFDGRTKRNESYELPGRPGFAFPINQQGAFVLGVERTLGIYDTRSHEWSVFETQIDRDVEGTIVNDGVVFDGGLIFGCKDLEFQHKKAGLYLWRTDGATLHRLRNDQICSNGKALVQLQGRLTLLDIDSPTKTVVAYPLDLKTPALGEPRIVVDLRDGDGVPDGMILTPDEKGVIVALYNPSEVHFGEARQYSLATGAVEAVWRTPGSPQVTCPQLIAMDGKIRLVLTTAVETMPAERRVNAPNAGCLFVGETPFDSLPPQPMCVV